MRHVALVGFLLVACAPADDAEGVCEPGADQTCNLDPEVSSLHGRCEDDGTCTCLDGFELDEASGLCR